MRQKFCSKPHMLLFDKRLRREQYKEVNSKCIWTHKENFDTKVNINTRIEFRKVVLITNTRICCLKQLRDMDITLRTIVASDNRRVNLMNVKTLDKMIKHYDDKLNDNYTMFSKRAFYKWVNIRKDFIKYLEGLECAN